jgi:aryl-alcohol dehydrogenase-like predicted oxidoreductase
MHTRAFGKSRRMVSEVGLGCWQLGGVDWGLIEDKDAEAILRAAIDSGVTFLDTADVYGEGRSEKLIGKFLKRLKKPESIFVATKLGRMPKPGWPGNFTRKAVRKHTEDCLRRLGVEALDLQQLHCVPPDVLKDGEIFDWLRELKKEGKIKQFGASVESMDEALVCLEQPGFGALQIIFNIFRQKPIDVLFKKAKAKNVAIIVRLPLASGLLAGRFIQGSTFPKKDHRNYNRDGKFFNVGETFAGLPFEKGVELADQLKPLVPRGMTMAQWSQRWILDHDAVSVIIPGASRPQQAVANAKVGDLKPLSGEVHKKLADFYREKVAAHIRGLY